MFFTVIGTLSATVFGIVTFNLVGYDGLAAHAWIDAVFWSLILSGGVVDYLRCRFCAKKAPDRFTALCLFTPCFNKTAP